MARRVEDLKLALPILAGLDERDPFTFDLRSLPAAVPPPADLRIAYWTGDDRIQPSDSTRAALETAATCLRNAGARVTHVKPPYDLQVFSRVLFAVVCSDIPGWRAMAAEYEGDAETFIQEQIEALAAMAKDFGDVEIKALKARLPDVRSSVVASLRDFDAVICPVTKTPAVPHRMSFRDISNFDYPGLMGTAWSLPSGTVRCGTSADNLPIGAQIVGRPNREDIVLAVLGILEDALGGWQPPPL